MTNNKPVGTIIREFRTREGFSQFDLELLCNFSNGSLSRIESGATNPTKETISKLIEKLKLNSYEAAMLYKLDIDLIPQLMSSMRKINTATTIEQLLQLSVDEIVQRFNLLGAMFFLIEGDVLKAKTYANTWYKDFVLKTLTPPFHKLSSPMDNPDNLLIKSIKEDRIIQTEDISNVGLPFMSSNILSIVIKFLKVKSVLIIPLKEDSKIIGTMLFTRSYESNFEDEIKIFTEYTEFVTTTLSKISSD